MMEVVISWIFVFNCMLQDYLVDHDRTAGSLGFKEVFLVPKTFKIRFDQNQMKTFLLNQPEEAHELSTEDRVVALP